MDRSTSTPTTASVPTRRRWGRLVAAALAATIGLPGAVGSPPAAQAAVVGAGFTVTAGDLAFILKQIKIAERHAATRTAADPCGTLVGPAANQVPDRLTSYGLRTVDGTCNNLFPGREGVAAAGRTFPRLSRPRFADAEAAPPGFPAQASSSYAQKSGEVYDSQPRLASNLIVDQTSTNPAAVAAAAFPVRTQGNPGLHPCTTDPDPLASPPVEGVPAGCVPSHQTLFIPNVTTDVGLSPPYNSLFTFFGQFFDHGVDQTVKGGGTVFVPLRADDPLRTLGPDGRPGTGDEVPASRAFMVLTRAANQPGPDGALGTADDVQEATNTNSPWIDQSQTYTSHPAHQAFLREYELVAGRPAATGRLLGGLEAGATYPGSPDGRSGLATWASTKRQAAEVLGLRLSDADALDVPMIATDPYGNVVPGPARGLPQYVMGDGSLVEGDLANPVPVPAGVRHFHVPFLTDIAHHADPSPRDTDRNPATPPVAPTPDADDVPATDPAAQPAGTYDDEMLDAHFVAGDGRANENIALSAVHQIFHSEHDRLVADIEATLATPGNEALDSAYRAVDTTASDPTRRTFTYGERLFQAARFVNEMEYQHIVFEDFGRKVQPAIRPFRVYSPDLDPAVQAEFAHAVYRFGHSMLDDTVARTNADGSDNSLSLVDAFLDPVAYQDGGSAGPQSPEAAAGSLLMGASDQVGNELDEFVTEALRNNLLGLPLDLAALNITRARETGVPSLNAFRRQLHAETNDGQLAPYTSWSDFGQHLKHPESLINFVAAYGRHPSITGATTVAAKREAAKAIVDPTSGTPTDPAQIPADAAEFMFGTGPWADAGGLTTTGLEDVDLWVGGLAEATNVFGGLLGSTFDHVFTTQMESLQDGDRFYYLARTPGMNLRTQLESNSFAELVMRNTVGTDSLKADAFATADCRFDLQALAGTPAGFAASGATVADDPASECDEQALLLRRPDGTLQYRATNTVDPPGINGQSVYQGSTGPDRVHGGNDNDTFWGGESRDVIEGGGGDDVALGGLGNDTVTDTGGADVLKGGPGNDAVDGGIDNDILMGGDGSDLTNGGAGDNEAFSGPGNDFAIGGQGADAVLGDGGDDWIQGGSGQDLLIGDHAAPFFDDPAEDAPGNDVFVGQVGENDYDAEGGDDVMTQHAAIDRQAGAGGFDWAIHQYDTVGADDDMAINNFVDGAPVQVVVNRDRWQEVEGVSGSAFDDVIRGTDDVPKEVAGGGFAGCNALDARGVGRIAGLGALLPPLTGDLAPVVAASASGSCPLTGPIWGDGEVLLGGPGSDTLEGRGADDVLDGDRMLRVRISVRTDPADPATEIGSTDLLEKPATTGTFGPGTAGETLQKAVFDGDVDPGHLVVVREVVAAPPTDASALDTAVFTGPRASYTVSVAAGVVTVTDTTGADGTDTLRGVERLRFSDQTLDVATPPSAPVVGTAVAGPLSATVAFRAGTATAGSPVTEFRVQVLQGGTVVRTVAGVPANATSAQVTGLTAGTSYTFRVVAVNLAGTSAPSAASNAVVPTGAAPVVTATSPAAGATGVQLGANATATFDVPVLGADAANVTLRATASGASVAAAVTYNATTRVVTLDPTTNLAPSTSYTLTLSGAGATGIRSTTGTPLVTRTVAFTTQAAPDVTAPTVSASTPGINALLVSRTANQVVTFSEAVLGASGTTVVLRDSAGAVVPSVVTTNAAGTQVTVNPNGSLRALASYRLTLTGGPAAIRDRAGNPLVTRTIAFSTGLL